MRRLSLFGIFLLVGMTAPTLAAEQPARGRTASPRGRTASPRGRTESPVTHGQAAISTRWRLPAGPSRIRMD